MATITSSKLAGARKIVTCGMGLGSLLVLAGLTSFAHFPTDALETLAWSVVFLTGTALGANVGEHAFKKPSAGAPVEPAKIDEATDERPAA